MFIAQLKNKLTRTEEDLEDLLTSNVFGVWRYLPPHLGLQQFLVTAQRNDGTLLSNIGEIIEAKLEFWQWFKRTNTMRGGEPDLLLEIRNSSSQKFLILVESKYLSGKSNIEDSSFPLLPTDQLAREMQILRNEGRIRHCEDYFLIYITAHTCFPKQDIQEAISDLFINTGEASEDHFYWTTWRRLPAILTDKNLRLHAYDMAPGYERILTDLNLILSRLGLTFFEGFIDISNIGSGMKNWYFDIPVITFDWVPINTPPFGFKEEAGIFNWIPLFQQANILWRFNL